LDAIAGHPEAKRALEVAAAGGHHALLVGAPGIGKTLLAHALCGLLPEEEGEPRPLCVPPTDESLPEALEQAVAGRGVLVLDPLTRFRRLEEVVAALDQQQREQEEGCLVAATLQPCPCGQILEEHCRCTLSRRRRFIEALPWDLLARIPIWQGLRTPSVNELENRTRHESRTEAIGKARKAQAARSHGAVPVAGRLGYEEIGRWRFPPSIRRMLDPWSQHLQPSVRDLMQVWRLARTVADLEGTERIAPTHFVEAVGMHRCRTHAGRAAVLVESVAPEPEESPETSVEIVRRQVQALGAFVFHLRREMGLTQKELSLRSQVSKMQIGKIERAEIGRVHWATLEKVLSALKAEPRHGMAAIQRVGKLDAEVRSLVRNAWTGEWTKREENLLGGFHG
jgi:magnesium chelatase family protein